MQIFHVHSRPLKVLHSRSDNFRPVASESCR
jgi:hypothetical protein